MPGFYGEEEYDIAGFAVGIVQKSRVINGSAIKAGDALIGLASSGIHSNGFSLVRRLFGENPSDLTRYSAELKKSVGEEVLTPTRIYVKTILELVKKYQIKGIAHITGGGFIENIPRMLPDGLKARINTGSYEILPVFNVLAQLSGLDEAQLYNTFNMGVGMVLAVDSAQADSIVKSACELGEKAYIIGEVAQGEGGVELCR